MKKLDFIKMTQNLIDVEERLELIRVDNDNASKPYEPPFGYWDICYSPLFDMLINQMEVPLTVESEDNQLNLDSLTDRILSDSYGYLLFFVYEGYLEKLIDCVEECYICNLKKDFEESYSYNIRYELDEEVVEAYHEKLGKYNNILAQLEVLHDDLYKDYPQDN